MKKVIVVIVIILIILLGGAIYKNNVDNSHMSFLQNIFVSLDGKTIRTSAESIGFEENHVVEFDAE